MAAPVVQDLATLMAQLDPAYAQLRALTNQQLDALGGQESSQIAALDAAKNNSFTDINTGANSRGLAFSGIPVAEQARYLGEKYLPAVANVKATTNQNRISLQQQLAQLYNQQYTGAIGQQQQQRASLDDWNKMIAQQQFQASENAKSRAASSAQEKNWGQEFLNYINDQFKKAGGAGNKNVTRQQQDKWAETWFALNGVNGAANRQGYWDLFNSTFNRTDDPTKDWRYKR